MLSTRKKTRINKTGVLKFKKEFGFVTTPARSALMAKIRSSATIPEITLRKALYSAGFRYRVNNKKLPGSPDISNHKLKIAIFVDGSFWHGYNWKEKKKKIKSNREFWIRKIERNIQRDKENNLALKKMGFRVLRFWDHSIKTDLNRCVARIKSNLN